MGSVDRGYLKHLSGHSGKWIGITTYGGKVYCGPHFSTQLLIYDPLSGVMSGVSVAAFGTGGFRYSGILALGGSLYIGPCATALILKYNPATGNITGIPVDKAGQSWQGITSDGRRIF